MGLKYLGKRKRPRPAGMAYGLTPEPAYPLGAVLRAHGIFRAQNIIMLISVRIRRKMSIVIMNI